jgi:hypothetical protein
MPMGKHCYHMIFSWLPAAVSGLNPMYHLTSGLVYWGPMLGSYIYLIVYVTCADAEGGKHFKSVVMNECVLSY